MRKIIWIIIISLPAAALYCLAAIVQAGSLYTGERAERNLEIWGALFLLCIAAFIACVLFLWRKFPSRTRKIAQRIE